MTVWDQSTGWVVGLYACCGPQTGAGLPVATSCGSTQALACSISNTYQSAATNLYTAQDYGYTTQSENSIQMAPAATMIRQTELQNGAINHALVLTTDCVNNSTPYVFPAVAAALGTCGTAGFGPVSANRPSAGALLFLDYTPAQIASFGLPAWQTTILTAMSKYGAYIGITGKLNTGVQISADESIESGEAWKYYYPTSFLTIDPYWPWINAQNGLNGNANVGQTGCTTGTAPNPSSIRCIGAFLANIPKTIGPEGSDSESNSCTSGAGCYPSGHLHVADACIAKGYASQSGGCS